MVVPKTLANFFERKTQLYEQGATVRRIGLYVRNYSPTAAVYSAPARPIFGNIVHSIFRFICPAAAKPVSAIWR